MCIDKGRHARRRLLEVFFKRKLFVKLSFCQCTAMKDITRSWPPLSGRLAPQGDWRVVVITRLKSERIALSF